MKGDKRASLQDALAWMTERAEAASQVKQPSTKLATFADKRTPILQKLADAVMTGVSRRNDTNVHAIKSVGADYIDEEIMPEDARDLMAETASAATVYMTRSHSPHVLRRRVFTPFGKELPPSEFYQHMARLNSLFGGVRDVTYGCVRLHSSDTSFNITADSLRLLAYDLAYARGEIQ